MTRGTVIVLGETGRNFAAGMTGGVAYVMDQFDDFYLRLNQSMVNVYKLNECPAEEIAEVKVMIERHVHYTGSKLGIKILGEWDEWMPNFTKVFPKDYERMLQAIARMEDKGLAGDEAVMAAFQNNARVLARLDGN